MVGAFPFFWLNFHIIFVLHYYFGDKNFDMMQTRCRIVAYLIGCIYS